MRILRWCGLVLPALLAAALPAQADSVGDLLPIAIPGFAAAPGVTARSRLHPEYLQRPVTLGPRVRALDLFPSLTVGAGVDTAPGEGQEATAFATLRPALRIVDTLLGLGAFVGGSFDRYARDPVVDANQVTTALGIAVPFGADRVTIAGAHLSRTETALGLAAGDAAAPFDVAVNDGRIALDLGFGDFTASERIGVDEQAVTVRGTVPAGFDRRTRLSSETGIETAGNAPLRGLLLLRAGTTHYQGALPGSGFADTTSLGLLGGFVTDAADVWRLRVIGGAEREHHAAGGPPSNVTAVYDVALGWTPDPLLAFELDVVRDAGPETGLGVPGTAVTTEQFALADAFARNLLLTASVKARQGRVATHAAAETDLDAGARWHVSRRFALEPAASLVFRHNLEGTAPREARVTVALVWTP